jgi:Rrf2 family protein
MLPRRNRLAEKELRENFMKLTRASSYALQALAEMVADKPDGANPFVPSHRTAKGSGIPGGFLLKVLKPLVNARILMSLKGPHGGYRLARPASKITLLEVIEAVDGPLRGFAPVAGTKASALDARLQEVCEQVATQTRSQLQRVRLSDLAGKK